MTLIAQRSQDAIQRREGYWRANSDDVAKIHSVRTAGHQKLIFHIGIDRRINGETDQDRPQRPLSMRQRKKVQKMLLAKIHAVMLEAVASQL